MSMTSVPAALAAEFETILRSANAEEPDIVNWRFDGLDVAGVTPGQYEPDNKYWHPNRQELIALARFTTELRSERWEGKRVNHSKNGASSCSSASGCGCTPVSAPAGAICSGRR